MALLTLSEVSLAYGHVALLDHVNFALEEQERVGLIGRNGTGKSSFLKLLAALELPDDGRLQKQQNLRLSYVAQEPVLEPDLSVFEQVALGLSGLRDVIQRYESTTDHDELDTLQTQIEAQGGWGWEQLVETTLTKLQLDPLRRIGDLSGGLKKRVALAQGLVTQPQVLLLDEPTNHLDLDAILWLEGLLKDFAGSIVVITHDRSFLDAVSTRIVELDRGILRSYPGNFATYEATKARELLDESLAQARFDKLLAQEEVWIRQGVEARRTRSVARIKRLDHLRDQRAARRDTLGRVRLGLDAGERSGKIVAELDAVSKHYGDKIIVQQFTATILRGDKIGLIGPNGSGKTTLLKMMLGELQPDSGLVRLGSNIQVAYFDQMREALRLDATLADTISPGSEWIEIGSQRKHVMSYLGDFLFSPQRANSPVSTLSGGERNRLLLARLFAKPSNVLVLDEPTNDLDIDTLDLLEDLLERYEGTVFLVSHDRRFLNNVVTSTIVWEGRTTGAGQWREFEGNVDDWLTQSSRMQAATERGTPPIKAVSKKIKGGGPSDTAATLSATPDIKSKPQLKARKLSHKEQRELDGLPLAIEHLESEQKTISDQLADTALYTQEPQRISDLHARYETIDAELMRLLERWDILSQP